MKNIPTDKKNFLLHGSSISKIWYYRKLLELKLVGPKALQQMKLVLVDKSTIQKDKDNLLNEIKTRSIFGDKKLVLETKNNFHNMCDIEVVFELI